MAMPLSNMTSDIRSIREGVGSMETWENEADFLKYMGIASIAPLRRSGIPQYIIEDTMHMWETAAKLAKDKTGKSAKPTNYPFGVSKELGVPHDNS